MSSVAELVQQLAGTYGVSPVQVMTCEVTAVSSSERTCTVLPLTDNLESFAAQLMADIDDGLLILPTVGSTVKIMLSEIITPTVIQYSAIDEILIVSGGAAIKVYSSGVELQGADFGGIPKIKELEDNLNTLKDYIKNTLEPAIGTGFTAVGVGPSANGPAGKTAFDGVVNLVPINIVDMENPKVKHGGGI